MAGKPQPPKNYIGQKFGKLTVVGETIVLSRNEKNKYRLRKALCKCECGKEKMVSIMCLTSGHSTSCGCYASEVHRKRQTIHGESTGKKTIAVEYNTWNSLRARCNNPRYRKYNDYGGRGISVCERWMESYSNFLEDMGRRPSPKHSIDRIDNNGNYEPSNCRWATFYEQMNNRRRTKYITVFGETKAAGEWARIVKIPLMIIDQRIRKGWKPFDALMRPILSGWRNKKSNKLLNHSFGYIT